MARLFQPLLWLLSHLHQRLHQRQPQWLKLPQQLFQQLLQPKSLTPLMRFLTSTNLHSNQKAAPSWTT